jgi:hypothetical protein
VSLSSLTDHQFLDQGLDCSHDYWQSGSDTHPLDLMWHISPGIIQLHRFGRSFERLGLIIIFAWIFPDRNPCAYTIIKSGEAPTHGRDAWLRELLTEREYEHSCIFLCSCAASCFEHGFDRYFSFLSACNVIIKITLTFFDRSDEVQ